MSNLFFPCDIERQQDFHFVVALLNTKTVFESFFGKQNNDGRWFLGCQTYCECKTFL